MQITQTHSEDLRREFRIVIPAADLDTRLTHKIEEMQPRIQLKGFRPGKAPTSFLKKTYGKSMMGEVVEAAVSESSQKAIKDHELKPAFPPRVDLVSELSQVVDGEADLEFTVKVDLMPEFEIADVSKLQLERLVSDVTDDDVEDALKRVSEQARTFTARPEGEGAELDDLIVIDFVGTIDGEEYETGKVDDLNLRLGSGVLIPGYEEQLIGAKAGEVKVIKATYPSEYSNPKTRGREAEFTTTIREVKKPDPLVIDDNLAKNFGMESLNAMKDRLREQLKNDMTRASRLHLKRRILDALDQAHSFKLPPTMVENEFEGIWKQVQAELQREGKTPEDEGKTEESLKTEYHDIAERRVRLGLVLARIGEQNGITVGADEVQRAVTLRARQFPGQEQQVFDYYASNPQAMNEVRAPIFEDKVVDFIAELAQVTEHKVPREILFLDPDEAEQKLKAQS
ncbi:MAG TPA: trigger factor [Rhizomicrobium sp.]|nr:trigger factor [Rhizomicrobium sp.]